MARKQLTTRPIEQDSLLTSIQREVIPYLRQTGALAEKAAPESPPEITGSRGGATVAVLAALLTALASAGIIKDSTVP